MKRISAIIIFCFFVLILTIQSLAKVKFRTVEDKMEGVIWYYSKLTPKKDFYPGTKAFPYDNTILYLYIRVEESGKSFLFFRAQLEPGKSWLFFDKIKFLADGERLELKFDKTKRKTTVFENQPIEWYNLSVNNDILEVIKKISGSKKIEMRFYGDNGSLDKKFKKRQKKGLLDVLAGWELLSKQ